MAKKLSKIKNALKIESDGQNIGRLDISGEVGFDWYGDAWDAGYFKMQMDNLGTVDRYRTHINSPGGSIIDGIAMFNYLVQAKAPVDVYIDGVAASIASVIAMAGDTIYMPSNTMMFIHQPWMYTAGNADELRKDADTLETMESALVASYMRHFKGTEDEIKDIMANDTWLTACEVADKFNNVVVLEQEAKIAASLDMSKLGDIPKEAKAFLGEEEEDKKGFFGAMLALLKREGMDKTANALESDLSNETETEEDEMTPEQLAAIKAEMKAELMAELKTEVKEPAEPKASVEVAFEGDMDNPEHIEAHAKKVELAQLKAAVDMSDLASIREYQEAVAKINGTKAPKATLPAGNAHVEQEPKAVKEQNKKDTKECMAKFMPKS